MHSQIPLNEPHFCVIRYDVMEVRTGFSATGHGYCVQIENDVTDFMLLVSYYLILMRVSSNAVTRRIRVGLVEF